MSVAMVIMSSRKVRNRFLNQSREHKQSERTKQGEGKKMTSSAGGFRRVSQSCCWNLSDEAKSQNIAKNNEAAELFFL